MGIRERVSTSYVFKPVARWRSADLAVDAIAKAIFFCEVRVGEKLPSEQALAGQLGINRTALREALKRMEKDGILQVRAGAAGGTFVVRRPPSSYVQMFMPPPVEVADFAEILITRRAIEPQIVQLAASCASHQDLRDMREILAPLQQLKGKTLYSDEEVEMLSMAALQFNTALGRATHTAFLETMMQVLTQQIEPIRRKAVAKNPAAAIDTLFLTFEALERNDHELIERVLAERFDYLERAWEEESGRRLWREQPSFLPSASQA